MTSFLANRLHKQRAIVSVKMFWRTWKFFWCLKSKNWRKISQSMSLCLFLKIPLFYCLQTIENNRKNNVNNVFFEFLHTLEKCYHFMCFIYWIILILLKWLHGWFNIVRNIWEIYRISRNPNSLKHQNFSNLETSQKNVNLKSEQFHTPSDYSFWVIQNWPPMWGRVN